MLGGQEANHLMVSNVEAPSGPKPATESSTSVEFGTLQDLTTRFEAKNEEEKLVVICRGELTDFVCGIESAIVNDGALSIHCESYL